MLGQCVLLHVMVYLVKNFVLQVNTLDYLVVMILFISYHGAIDSLFPELTNAVFVISYWS